MTRSNAIALAALVAVLACVLAGKLPGEALVTFLVGLGVQSPLKPSAE